MNKILLMVGAAALAVTMPTFAKSSQNKGGPKGHHSVNAKHGVKAKSSAHSNKGYAVTHARTKSRMAGLTDTNRDGRIDSRDVLDRNLDGFDDRTGRRYGGAACPPGLAKKSPACIPPGQAKRMFRQGQRLPAGYRYYTPFGNLPLSLRDRYNLSDDNRYIYRDNTIYVVDPATSLVSRIINSIL